MTQRFRILLWIARRRDGQSSPKISNYFARRLSHKKSSLMVAVLRWREEKALLEYRRRFTALAEFGRQTGVQLPARRPAANERQPEPKKQMLPYDAGRPRRDAQHPRRKGGRDFRHYVGAARALAYVIALRIYKAAPVSEIGRRELIAIATGCAIALCAAALYPTLTGIRVGTGGAGNTDRAQDAKTSYDRLLPDNPNPASPISVMSAVKSEQAPSQGSEAESAPDIGKKSEAAFLAPRSSLPDRPTVVRSERYLSDGRPIDAPAAVVPSVVRLNPEQQPPSLAVAKPESSPPDEGGETMPAPANPLPQQASIEAQTQDLPGYYIQVKSDQNFDAAQSELNAIREKHSGILGDASLVIRSADLKEKGMWFRVLGGPIETREGAESLCRKLKRGGLAGCIVQRRD
jgi:hypothetical protein